MAEQKCEICNGELWVCENHDTQPWNATGCMCGAGMPCICNPCDRDTPPKMPESFNDGSVH